jgi:hypothetical protein
MQLITWSKKILLEKRDYGWVILRQKDNGE